MIRLLSLQISLSLTEPGYISWLPRPAWNSSSCTVQIEALRIGPLYRYLVHAHDTFIFSCKWFIPTRFILTSFPIWFFHGVCCASLLLTLDCQYTSPASHDSKYAPWLGNCFFWWGIKSFPNVEKLWTDDKVPLFYYSERAKSRCIYLALFIDPEEDVLVFTRSVG